MQSRRSFIGRSLSFLGVLAVSGGTMFLTACGEVAQDLLTAFTSILNILSAAGIVPGGALVVTALDDVIAAITAYLNAPAADKTTLGMKLALIIADAQAELQTWFSGLHLTGPIALVVESLVSVLLATLAGFLPTLPQPPQESAKVRAAKALPRQIVYKPVATIHCTKSGLSSASKAFRSNFNQALTSQGYAKTF